MSGLVDSLRAVKLDESGSSLSDISEEDDLREEDFEVVVEERSRRLSVVAESYGENDPKPTVEIPSIMKSAEDTELLVTALKSCFLFKHRDRKDFESLVPAFSEVTLEAGVTFIKEGDDGDCMYVLMDGEVDVTKEGAGKVNLMKKGDLVGEIALMYNAPRAGTCTTKTQCRLMRMARDVFVDLVHHAANRKYKEKEAFIASVPLFKDLSAYDKNTVVAAVVERFYEAGAEIIRQGDAGHEMFFVADGACVATKENEGEVMRYKVGDFFGELALVDREPRKATVTADGPVKLLVLDKKPFYAIAPQVAKELRKQRKKYSVTK